MAVVLNPRNFPLQIVKRVLTPFDGEEWLFEIKHDGSRMIAVRDDRVSAPVIPVLDSFWDPEASGATVLLTAT